MDAGLLLASYTTATRPVPTTTLPASRHHLDLVHIEKGKSSMATGTGEKGKRPRTAIANED
jgi:hypothetical protein